MVERTEQAELQGMVGATFFPGDDKHIYLFKLRKQDKPDAQPKGSAATMGAQT